MYMPIKVYANNDLKENPSDDWKDLICQFPFYYVCDAEILTALAFSYCKQPLFILFLGYCAHNIHL